ncbi:MAG TPA: hypothetical protein VEI02_10425 [Planctomycetota bacterium]|nr:hypothetical protein [Planctomycetota bacterium]
MPLWRLLLVGALSGALVAGAGASCALNLGVRFGGTVAPFDLGFEEPSGRAAEDAVRPLAAAAFGAIAGVGVFSVLWFAHWKRREGDRL